MRTNILCLETSAAKCSVALAWGANSISYREAKEAFSHVSQITLLVKEVLTEARISFDELNAVAISGGPGSYTGLRVGTSTAKGICFGASIPLITVSTLEAIAHTLRRTYWDIDNSLFISVIDARRDEVYMSGFDQNLKEIIPPKAYILHKDSFKEEQASFEKIIIGGDAGPKAAEIIANTAHIYEELCMDAKHMIPLAKEAFESKRFEEINSYKPFYLKPPNITVSKKQFFRKN